MSSPPFPSSSLQQAFLPFHWVYSIFSIIYLPLYFTAIPPHPLPPSSSPLFVCPVEGHLFSCGGRGESTSRDELLIRKQVSRERERDEGRENEDRMTRATYDTSCILYRGAASRCDICAVCCVPAVTCRHD